jgi:hypothetical protein
VGQREEQDLGGAMAAQVVHDRAETDYVYFHEDMTAARNGLRTCSLGYPAANNHADARCPVKYRMSLSGVPFGVLAAL